MINDATFPYTYQRHHERFTVYRNGEASHTLISVQFPTAGGSINLFLSDEELKDLSGMLTDCLDTAKPLFTEVV